MREVIRMRYVAWILALALIVIAAPAFAAPTAATGTSSTVLPDYTITANQNVDVNAGKVYEVDVNVESITKYWAGIIGRINETVVLGSDTAKLFTWSITPAGVLYWVTKAAGATGDVNWASLDGDLTTTAIDTILGGWSPTTAENYEATFANVSSAAGGECNFAINNLGITPTNYPRYVQLDNNAGTPTWTTCGFLGDDTVGGADTVAVFAVNVVSDTAFNGSAADYETMVPAKDGVATTYLVYKG